MTAIAARFNGSGWGPPKVAGVVGVLLGAFAFWLALPPLHTRTTVVPVVVGILGVAAGIWTWSRGQRRLGGGAVVSGLLGIVLGISATQSSVGNLDQVVVWSALLAATLRYATPLVYAAIGGLYCERSGVVNVALEGMLLTGAYFGIWADDFSHSWVVALLVAMAAGAGMATIHAIWSIHLKVDQIITGTAINFLALGITGYLFLQHYGNNGTPGDISNWGIPDIHIGFIAAIPFIGSIFGQLNLMIWLSFLLLILTYVFVFRTPYGLRMRAVGEHPRAADTVGISVYKTRYAAVISSGAIAALGGAYLSIGFVHSFNQDMTSGTGFIGLAALIFGKWRPFPTWCATLLFGFSSALGDRLPTAYGNQWGTLFQALPYLLTLIAVAGVVGRSVGPAASGRPYDKQ
ncbi:MAG TPA: ABC transporter permease [Gaiellaceae bacterium]|nr:ABC transporter permease [Gaiellaceae bacterium]